VSHLCIDTGLTHAACDRGGLLQYAPGGNPAIDVRWLVGLARESPGIAADRPPDFLSCLEQQAVARLRFAKRRREWLLGRWTAKQLYLRSREGGQPLPMHAITIANDPDGAPYLLTDGEGRIPLSLSISHCRDRAFCALGSSFGYAVGADVEHVEPRDPAFVQDFFTADEGALVSDCPAPWRDAVVTVLWSAKEAVLKAARCGLRVDTRRVEISHLTGLDPSRAPGASYGDDMPETWGQVQVSTSWPAKARVAAWWAAGGGYAYTLAVTIPFSCDSLNSSPVL